MEIVQMEKYFVRSTKLEAYGVGTIRDAYIVDGKVKFKVYFPDSKLTNRLNVDAKTAKFGIEQLENGSIVSATEGVCTDEILNYVREYGGQHHDAPYEIQKQLVQEIRKYYPEFSGPIHTTEFENFISIIKSGRLYSREVLNNNHISFTDRADQGVIQNTDYQVMSYARFYYRDHTPTYARAKYLRPVMLMFSADLFLSPRARFCNISSACKNKMISNDINEAIHFNWCEILKRGPMSEENKKDDKHFRNCDFLMKEYAPVNMIEKVFFINANDLLYAKKMLVTEISNHIIDEGIFEVAPERFNDD